MKNMYRIMETFLKMHRKENSRKPIVLAIIGILALSTAVTVSVFMARATIFPTCMTVVTSTENGSNVFTAKAINEASGPIDATGCDIGDYIDQGLTVSTITVHDANKFGIFVDSGCITALGCIPGTSFTATISGATVYNIGNHGGSGCATPTTFCPNGVQFGIGILYDSSNSALQPLVKGFIDSSSVYAYQKGGIVVKHHANVNATNDAITGLGHVDFIAQNGIEYAFDTATGVVRGNTVYGNFYTGGEGLLSDGTACGPSQGTTCPPGRTYAASGLLLVFVDPTNIQRGQNNIPGPGSANGNEHPYAVVTDSLLD